MDNLTQRRSGRWPLPAAFAAYLLAVFFIEYPLLQFTHGLLIYPWDATYLQMATAKNLAFNHTWNMNVGGLPASEMIKGASGTGGNGINPNWQSTGQPGLAPVSLLYTWILALFFIVAGPLPGIPLLINLVVAMVLLRVIQRWLSRQKIVGMAQFCVLLGVIFLAALPIRTAQGMEEILEALWVVLLVFGLGNWLEKERAERPVNEGVVQMKASVKKNEDLPGGLLFYGMMVAATRYEGLLLIGVAALLLLILRKWEAALQLVFASVLPLLCLGLYYLHRDNHFIPYPQGWGTWGFAAGSSAGGSEKALVGGTLLALLIGIFFRRPWRSYPHYRYIQLLLALTGLLQYFLTGSREATWLIAGIIPLAGLFLLNYFKEFAINGYYAMQQVTGRRKMARRGIALLAVGILVLPLVLQSGQAFRDNGDACRRLYRKEYQMGRFLRSYYDREGTAVNDIGAAAYLTNGRKYAFTPGNTVALEDGQGSAGEGLAGAGQGQPFTWDTTASYLLDSLLWKERVRIAVVSGNKDNTIMLQDWIKIASWGIDPARVPAPPDSDMLLFYAYDSAASLELKSRLQAFQPSLPPGVRVKYY